MSESDSALKWLYTALGKEKRKILLSVVFQCALATLSLSYIMALRAMINAASDGNTVLFRQKAILFVSLILTLVVLRFFYRVWNENLKALCENKLKEGLMDLLMKKDYQSVSAVRSGEWMNRFASDTVQTADQAVTILPEIAGMCVRLFGALYLLFRLDGRFFSGLAVLAAILLLITLLTRNRLKVFHKNERQKDGYVRAGVQEQLENLAVVKAYGQESETLEDTRALMNEHRRSRMRRAWISGGALSSFSLVMNGIYAYGAVYCAAGIMAGTIPYGTLTAVLQLISQISGPLSGISGYIPKYYTMTAGAERLMEALKYPDDLCENPMSPQEAVRFYNDELKAITLKDLRFDYDRFSEEGVLKNFSAVIRKGDCIMITGHSGCGKSTILKLLLSLYRPQNGTITIEGKNGSRQLSSYDRALFAYVPQGSGFTSGTIRKLVTGADEKDNDEKLHEALRICCAEEFVNALPEGADTALREKGAGLSEGQIQRLSIARAVYSGRPVLLLDEVTSALDENTEQTIITNLKQMTNRTLLVVTHRSSAWPLTDQLWHCENENGTDTWHFTMKKDS